MPFSGNLVHAAFLSWMQSAAPEIAAWLHEGKKRRLFTCSSLHHPLPAPKMREAEYKNVHLPLDPQKTYPVRITLLLGDLFPLLYETLMHFDMHEAATRYQPFMRLGKQSFLLQEVVLAEDPSGWCGHTSFAALVEQAKVRPLGSNALLTLDFASLTTFSWINVKNKIYGNYFAMAPLPHYIFPMLAIRWRETAPADLADIVQVERIEQYIRDDGIVLSDYDLHTHYVTFTDHPQRGFVGACTYQLRGPDEALTPEMPLTVRQQILLLAYFAFFTGIGYKTAMGLGQVRVR